MRVVSYRSEVRELILSWLTDYLPGYTEPLFHLVVILCLKNHPSIQQEMTLLVRQLAPSNLGLPIEIYVFTNTTNWAEYEDIQADIFDHIFAILSDFDLVAHESPVGQDIKAFVDGI